MLKKHVFSDPCFNSGENLTGLSRGDAEFVLVIHSNSGGLGKRDPLGKFVYSAHKKLHSTMKLQYCIVLYLHLYIA